MKNIILLYPNSLSVFYKFQISKIIKQYIFKSLQNGKKITLIIKHSCIFFTSPTDEFANVKTDIYLYSEVQISNSQVVTHFMCKIDVAYLLAMESRVQAQWRIIIKH